MSDLTSLELVYLADQAGSDDDLLEYVTHTYPRLTHLELHRYRANREEVVDHVGITSCPDRLFPSYPDRCLARFTLRIC